VISETKEIRTVIALIEETQRNYSVDASRIYACGFSMGGYGTWNLLMLHSKMFAAGIAMCGAADPSKAHVLKDIPVWAIHGAQDPTVPVAGSQEIVNAIKNAGGTKINYTELPDNQHDVWTYTYSNYEIFNWLFQQKKA
jgi:predicted peptidase